MSEYYIIPKLKIKYTILLTHLKNDAKTYATKQKVFNVVFENATAIHRKNPIHGRLTAETMEQIKSVAVEFLQGAPFIFERTKHHMLYDIIAEKGKHTIYRDRASAL